MSLHCKYALTYTKEKMGQVNEKIYNLFKNTFSLFQAGIAMKTLKVLP